MMGGQPIIILKEGTEREKGKGAVYNNIAAARAVADAVKSTLGPKGMDKMLVEVAKTQDDEVGDGTTSAVVLAGELLKAAESLIEQEVHPTIIVNGYRMAAAEAVRRRRGQRLRDVLVPETWPGSRALGSQAQPVATSLCSSAPWRGRPSSLRSVHSSTRTSSICLRSRESWGSARCSAH